MSSAEEMQKALMDLADALIIKFQSKVQHTKPLVRASLNQGYMAGVTDTLKALEAMRTQNHQPAPKPKAIWKGEPAV